MTVRTKPTAPVTAGGGGGLELVVVSQNTKTVTVGWQPVVCLGYVLYRGVGSKPVSNSWDPTKNEWTVAKTGGTIRVVALGAAAVGTINPPA